MRKLSITFDGILSEVQNNIFSLIIILAVTVSSQSNEWKNYKKTHSSTDLGEYTVLSVVHQWYY